MTVSPAPATDKTTHITAFDTVRGLAALSVVFSHYIGAYGWPTESQIMKRVWTYSPLHIFWDGFAAVSLFYVLSGLVLSNKYFRQTKHPELSQYPLSHFLISRVFRIWPPYLVIFLLSYALRRWADLYEGAMIPPVNSWLFSTWNSSIPLVKLAREGFLLQLGDYSLVPQGWTLPIELAISFLVPVGILLASRHTGWLAFFTLLLIGPLGATYFVFHFAAGILLAKYYADIRTWLESRRGWKLVVLLLGLFLYTFRYTLPVYFSWKLPTSIPWLVTGAGAALVLMVVIASERVRTFLSLSWLRFVGKVSFSIYLIHFLVLILLTPRLFQLIEAPQSALALTWWLGAAFTVLMTIGLAALSYRFVEVPSMTLGKSLPRRFADWKMRRVQAQPVSGK